MQVSKMLSEYNRLGYYNAEPKLPGRDQELFRRLFNPINELIRDNEQGVWYDPSDLSTMFQDEAGTTPVTAVEQPVGRILDKSKGLVLGSELVTNGDFSNPVTTGWVASNSTLTVVSSKLRVSMTGASAVGQASYPISVVSGRTYKISAELEYVSGAAGQAKSVTIRNGTDSAASTALLVLVNTTSDSRIVASGIYTATATETVWLAVRGGIAGSAYVLDADNISVRELTGNHATQATTASRPRLSARVNLLTATETLATQTVTTLATTQTLRFEGAGTVTLSGTATGTYSAGSYSVTTTAGNLTLTVSGTVTKADLRAANMGFGLPAYQRVNTATDYDTAGYPLYLLFDGVDDFLQTNRINFTSTDKMTVVAGVRKLSDGSTGVVAELSSDINSNNQCFTFLAPSIAGSYRFFSKGTLIQGAGNGNFAPAPNTSVITGIGNISGDVVSIRRNGALLETNSTDQGTGNYGNYPLYIGRRGETTFPFNGNLYGLVIRGALSDANQIANAERFMNSKTGAY